MSNTLLRGGGKACGAAPEAAADGAAPAWGRTSEGDGAELEAEAPPLRLDDVAQRDGHDGVGHDGEEAPLEGGDPAALRDEPVLEDDIHA